MKVVKLGHGNSFPLLGTMFYLQAAQLKSQRIGFLPTSLMDKNSGKPFKVYYSIRSSAHLTRLTPGQVWRVRVARYRRLLNRKEDASHLPPTVMRIDLYDVYDSYRGWYNPHRKTWEMLCQTAGMPDPRSSRPAEVRFIKYAVVVTNKDRVCLQAGYFPEVVDTNSGTIIMRYQPNQLLTIPNGATDDVPMLPDDGIPLAWSKNCLNHTMFIVTREF